MTTTRTSNDNSFNVLDRCPDLLVLIWWISEVPNCRSGNVVRSTVHVNIVCVSTLVDVLQTLIDEPYSSQLRIHQARNPLQVLCSANPPG